MKQSFVDVNGIPTMVTTWGGHIDEKLNSKEIVICIPGNPGLSGYYYRFLEIVHDKLKIPVWIIGHTGHEEPEDKETLARIPELKGNEKLYDTYGQIEYKVCDIISSRKDERYEKINASLYARIKYF